MPFQQLDRVSDNTAPPNTGRVVADEHEKRQRQHVLMSAADRATGWCAVLYRCTAPTASQLGDQTTEDGQCQHSTMACDPHLMALSDLIAI